MSDLLDWRPFFPLDQPRAEQAKAIEFVIEQLVGKGSNYVVMELGTGVGKSAIAITLAKWAVAWHKELVELDILGQERPKSYILTSQKILQDQYVREFKNDVSDLRSSANFSCSWLPNQTCAETMRVKDAMSNDGFDPMALNAITCVDCNCQYKITKDSFKQADIGVTNYSYFLSETVYAGGLKPRELLILDEAHNIEAEIRKWATITINSKLVSSLNLKVPNDDERLRKWMCSSYVVALGKLIKKQCSDIERAILTRKYDQVKVLSRQHEILDKHICQVNRYVKSIGGNKQDNYLIVRNYGSDVQLKPLNVTSQVRDLLFSRASKRIMMSATILDKNVFSRSMGLPKNEHVSFISIPSPFPKQNRPIFYIPVGLMSKKHVEKTLPKLTNTIKELLALHQNEKGMIHCHTYSTAQHLISTLNNKRLISHTSKDRDVALHNHLNLNEPTVLLSPSMTEGVDLKDDASRFQIICKIPYPYIGDPIIAEKMKRDPQWYPWQTARTLLQSIGRSIRSSDDSAVTYILDESWERFYSQNKKFFPDGFDELLISSGT